MIGVSMRVTPILFHPHGSVLPTPEPLGGPLLAANFLVLREENQNLTSKIRIAGAGLVEECLASLSLVLYRIEEDPLQLLISIAFHTLTFLTRRRAIHEPHH